MRPLPVGVPKRKRVARRARNDGQIEPRFPPVPHDEWVVDDWLSARFRAFGLPCFRTLAFLCKGLHTARKGLTFFASALNLLSGCN